MHIGSTEIERPRHIVEGRHKHTVGVQVTQRLANARQLRRHRLAGQLHRLYLHLRGGNLRAISPHNVQRIEIGPHGDATLATQVAHEHLHVGCRIAHAIHAHLCGAHLAQLTSQPLTDGRRAFYLQFHQLELGARELVGSSDEITAVGPQGGRVHRHHSCSRRPIESTNPLTALPAVGHILRVVGVGTGEDKSIEILAAHHLAQGFQSLSYVFLHNQKI